MTLNAELFGNIYATLTVNIDSPAGLSVDETYPDEVADFRRRKRICEFGKFAVEPSVRSKRPLATSTCSTCMPIASRVYRHPHRDQPAPPLSSALSRIPQDRD